MLTVFLSFAAQTIKQIEIKRAEPQRPMLKSNSSSMTNISMQSSHNNGYLSGLTPYVPLSTPHHQLHAAHHHHSIMPPPAQNTLDTSAAAFQFAAAAAAATYHHPNSYSTAIPIHHPHHSAHHSRPESLANTTPLIAGYAPTPLSSQPASHHQLVSHHQPWPLPSYPLGHLHSMQPSAQHHHQQQPPPHHSMQSPTAPNIIAHQQAVSIIQNNSASNLIQQQQQNLSRPGSPVSLSTSNNNSTASNNPAPSGTPIRAVLPGTVTESRFDGQGGWGWTVVLDHGGGLTSRYSHNSANLVRVGARVNAGEVIARVGSTGNSSGAHVDYRLYQGGRSIDPSSLQ